MERSPECEALPGQPPPSYPGWPPYSHKELISTPHTAHARAVSSWSPFSCCSCCQVWRGLLQPSLTTWVGAKVEGGPEPDWHPSRHFPSRRASDEPRAGCSCFCLPVSWLSSCLHSAGLLSCCLQSWGASSCFQGHGGAGWAWSGTMGDSLRASEVVPSVFPVLGQAWTAQSALSHLVCRMGRTRGLTV